MLLDIFRIVIWAGFFQSLVLGLLLLTRPANKTANFYLTAMLILFSVQGVLIVNDDLNFYLKYTHLSRISWILPFFFGPLLYLYAKKLTQENAVFYLKDLWHFIPVAIYGIYTLPYFLKSADEKRTLMSSSEFSGEAFYWDELKILQSLLYLILCFKIVRKHQRIIKNRFSNIENIRLQWLTHFIYFLIFIWGISFLTIQLSLVSPTSDFEPVVVIYLVSSLGFYLLGYIGINQPLIFNPMVESVLPRLHPELEIEIKQKEKYIRSSLSPAQIEIYSKILTTYITKEKSFLKNDLTIDELSRTLKISKHHLSQIINDKFSMNFYDYINSYRVDIARELLHSQKYKNQTILSLGFEAGFNSKTTFNTVFKKFTGLTPSQFAKNVKK